jgi:protoheme IX farnesyltransferase
MTAAGARLDTASLAALVRPRITLLVLAQTAASFLLERPASFAPLPGLLAGTALVSVAGCSLNHWMEREADARMERTRLRPLVTGALSPAQVLAGGLLSLLAGLALLALSCPPLTVGLELLAAAIYLGVYTPLKRRTSTNTWIGAFPGALPVLAGAAAAGHGLSRLSLCVFLLVLLWQLPHFFAIASMYREQYRSGGMRMLSGDDPHDHLLRWDLPLLVMSVLLVSALPVLVGPARAIYAATALFAGLIFLWAAFGFRRAPERASARRVVLASVAYLPLVLGALVVDVACVGHAAPAPDGTDLPVLSQLPPFQLVAQDSSSFTRETLADGGAPWVVDFIFTSCAGICVPMSQRVVELQKEGLPVRFLSITVDPERDSPQVLTAYRSRYGGDPRNWTLATGTHEELERLGNQGFRLPVDSGSAAPDGTPEFTHSGRFALVDGRGRVRGTYAHNDAVALQALRRDAAALLAATPSR